MSIGAIISYVDSGDKLWRRDYTQATSVYNISKARFRTWNTLKYLFRGISEHMPFINEVILIVARESQVPKWIDTRKVRIVYHKDFIPKQHLPTFSSCTIESFLWNISNLPDKIVYFNDDMFPNSPMVSEDFFTGDRPNIGFTEPKTYPENHLYRVQCRNGMNLITDALNLPTFEAGKFIRPYHITTAITKDSLEKVGKLCEHSINSTVSKLRNRQNVNQYIYSYYQYFTDGYEPKSVEYKYFEISEKTIGEIKDAIAASTCQMLCLNESDLIKDFPSVHRDLVDCFDKKYPNKCKYEL